MSDPLDGTGPRPTSAGHKIALAVVASVPGGVVALVTAPWTVTVLVGWSGFALVWLGLVWREIGPASAERTRAMARREDTTRRQSLAICSAAAVVSLSAALAAVRTAHRAGGWREAAIMGLTVLAVTASWAVVHTAYTLRYADLYYADPVGGIDFNGTEQPAFADFAYVAFTVGVAFAVSDTNVTSTRIRPVVLRHSLIAYLFGGVIIGLVINIIAGLT